MTSRPSIRDFKAVAIVWLCEWKSLLQVLFTLLFCAEVKQNYVFNDVVFLSW